MNIITETSRNGRIQDGIATILKLDDDTFDKVIEELKPTTSRIENINFYYSTDTCIHPQYDMQLGLEQFYSNGRSIIRGYYADGSKVPIPELFSMFERLLAGFPEGTRENTRLHRLLETRGLEAYKDYFQATSYGIDRRVLDKVFDILSNQELYEKFLDFDNNAAEFVMEGVAEPKREICKAMGQIFGEERQSGELRGAVEIGKDFYIPEMQDFQEKVKKAYDAINFTRYTNGLYEFRSSLGGTVVSRKADEPEFTIHPELRAAVYNDMPEDLSLEEKLIFIYGKLCKNLLYDEGFLYRNELNNVHYEGEFSREVMESIKPGSKVVCTDFSRMFAKFVNEIPEDVEAVLITSGEGRRMHFFAGVYTDKISATFDGTYAERQTTDDLLKAKLSMPLKGITARFDRDEILGPALAKVLPMIIGDTPMRTQDYIEKLDDLPKQELGKDNLDLRVKAAVEIAKKKGLYGNELTQFLNAIRHIDFFGPFIEQYYIGKPTQRNDQDSFDRIILLRRKNFGMENKRPFQVVITKSAEIEELTVSQIEEKYSDCVWEDPFHKSPDITLECDKQKELKLEKKPKPEFPDYDDR